MTARWIALMTAALLGFLLGARAVGGSAPVAPAASAAGVLERDAWRGSFWRPAGSEAARPVLRLEPLAWTPPAPATPSARPDGLAAVGAVVRLAVLE